MEKGEIPRQEDSASSPAAAVGRDGTGYILWPCHNLQANTPLENIIAMYDEAWKYGKM